MYRDNVGRVLRLGDLKDEDIDRETCQTGSKTFPPVDVRSWLGLILGRKIPVISYPVGL